MPVLTTVELDAHAMFGRDQPREHRQAAGVEREVVLAAAKLDAAHLHDAQAPPLRAVLVDGLLQADHAVRDAVQLQVGVAAAAVVQQQHGAVARREKNFLSASTWRR